MNLTRIYKNDIINMAEIFINRDGDNKMFELENDLEFTPDDNVKIIRQSDPQSRQPSTKKQVREIPFDGIDLITNRKKMGSSSVHSGSETRSVHSVGSNGSRQKHGHGGSDEQRRQQHMRDDRERGGSGGEDEDGEDASESFHSEEEETVGGHREEEERPKSYKEILEEKQDYLFKLGRLARDKRIKVRQLNLSHSLDEIRGEYNKIKREIDLEKSIRTYRRYLITGVNTLECVNKKFDPVGAKLDGFSEHTYESIEDYDDIFEELHDKHSSKGKSRFPPEVRLLGMLGMSAFMFHASKALINTEMLNVQDILKTNPELASNIRSAVFSSMNVANDPVGQSVRYAEKPSQRTHQAPAARSQAQEQMRGPSGMEDLLAQLHRNSGDAEESGHEDGSVLELPTSSAKRTNTRKKKREMNMGF